MALNLMKRFQAEGYKLELYYFGLLNEKECIDRVIQRSMTGGHDVSDEIVKFNFVEGQKKIKENLSKFENLVFIDSNTEYGRIVAHYTSKNGTKVIADNPPSWFNLQFAESFSKL